MNKRTMRDTANAKVGTIDNACARYGFGSTKMKEIASDAGAIIKIGRSMRVNFTVLDQYFDSLSGD